MQPAPDAALPKPDMALPTPDLQPAPDAALPKPDMALPKPDAAPTPDVQPTPDAALPKPDAAPTPDVQPSPDMALPKPDTLLPDYSTPDSGLPGGTVKQLVANPFGDGTKFLHVLRYHGWIYLGPNKYGSGAMRINPDGTSPTMISYSFLPDTSGNKTSNASSSPYPSIGRAGCAKDTPLCGPDNENGRGLFAAGTLSNGRWLVMGGSKSGGDLEYVYMTQDTGTKLTFHYVDLKEELSGETKGVSAMHVFDGRMYLGFPDTGNRRPYLVALKKTPPYPGLDVNSHSEAESLRADKMPGLGHTASTSIIDTIAHLKGRLYVFNHGGCMRSIGSKPRDYEDHPQDWAVCTPSAAAYGAKAPVVTGKVSGIEPADRAFSQAATLNGRLYVGRNTTAGPQLWRCTPDNSGVCGPKRWMLIAPSSADKLTSPFHNPNNTRISMVVATAKYLYVGFDNAKDGLVVFRASPTPTVTQNFLGLSSCKASLHPGGCAGLGGNGFAAGYQRINQAMAATFNGKQYVYLAVSGSGAAAVYRITD